jgi:regulator of extracellular matrix RemA (YlzA/DUF370 family)
MGEGDLSMSSVFIPIPISEVAAAAEKPSLTYALDLDKGRIVGKVNGLQAVNQAIRKAIITPRFKCLLYDNQYGSEIREVVIAKDASEALLRAMIPRMVEDALKPDTRILKVYDFSIDVYGERARVFFRADTVFGETKFEGAL